MLGQLDCNAESVEIFCSTTRNDFTPADQEYTDMGIFHLDKEGKDVERWDVPHVVPESSKYANTLY